MEEQSCWSVRLTPPCCAACSKWNGPNLTYATCNALAKKYWNKENMRLPFWTPSSQIIHNLMTARTRASEGSTCGAYIASEA